MRKTTLDKGEARGLRMAKSTHSQQWTARTNNCINALNLEAANGRWMRTRIQSVQAVQAVNGFYAEKTKTVALHYCLAFRRENIELDDVVTILENDIEHHQGNIQALHDCNPNLRDKLDDAIQEHLVLQGRVLELEQVRARKGTVCGATNQQLQDRML